MPLHIYLTFSEIFGNKPTESDFKSSIVRFKRDSTFRFLAMVNNLLATSDANSSKKRFESAQVILLRGLADANTYDAVIRFTKNEDIFERPIFHRQQILFFMKQVLLRCTNDGDWDPNTSIEDRKRLGKLCLMVNDLTVSPEQEARAHTDYPYSSSEMERVFNEMLAQMVPVYELFNPPDIHSALLRTQSLIQISNAKFPCVFDGKSLADYFESLSGLSLETFLQMVMCVYASVSTADLPTLVNHPEHFNIDPKLYFENLNFTSEEIERFLHLTSIRFSELPNALEDSPLRSTLLIQYDFTVFRNYPLFRMSGDILTFSDITFLTEKASFGLYYTIRNLLNKNNVDPQQFFQHWGHIFEDYVTRIFRTIYPEFAGRFYANLFYEGKEKIEAFDGVLEYPTALVVIQTKGGLLNSKAKYAGEVNQLLGEMDSKFGLRENKSGINQLVKNIERVFYEVKNKRRQVIDHDFSRIRVVYPVLIVNELSMGLGFAHWKLRSWFEQAMKSKRIDKDVTVKPLLVLTVEDLEMLQPYLEEGDFTFEDLAQFYSMQEYIRFAALSIRDVWYEPISTFRDVFKEFCKARGIKNRPNERQINAFSSFMDKIKMRFTSDAASYEL